MFHFIHSIISRSRSCSYFFNTGANSNAYTQLLLKGEYVLYGDDFLVGLIMIYNMNVVPGHSSNDLQAVWVVNNNHQVRSTRRSSSCILISNHHGDISLCVSNWDYNGNITISLFKSQECMCRQISVNKICIINDAVQYFVYAK